MWARRSLQIAGALGLGLLTVSWMRLAGIRPLSPARAPSRSLPPPPHTPSEVARWVARHHWTRAQQAVNQERYTMEAWDPDGIPVLESETWRLQLMARDRSGELRRALEAARRASALARTPQEAYAAALLRARLEDDAGNLDVELSQVRRLLALQPHNILSALTLSRLARRCRRESSARWASATARGRSIVGLTNCAVDQQRRIQR